MMQDRFARNPAVEIAPMKEETVLFNPGNNKFCVLNVTASFIWQTLEHPSTAKEISVAIVQHFANADEAQAERDVHSALDELRGIECVIVS